jgi:hypothetical protein
LESVAFGIPTVTTNLTGFGLWAKIENELNKNFQLGVEIIERDDDNYSEAAEKIKNNILEYAALSPQRVQQARAEAKALSEKASWSHFIQYYMESYDIAFRKQGARYTVHAAREKEEK